MKLSGNKLIESVVGVKAKSMVQAIESEISCTPYKKPVKESVFALVTTAGVHLKTQEVFDVEAWGSNCKVYSCLIVKKMIS